MMARPGIVWLASFPKSGNTWFRVLLANLAAGEKGPAEINRLDLGGEIASSRQLFESATMIDSGLVSDDDIDRLRPRVYEAAAAKTLEQFWIKVHDAYTRTPAGEPMFGGGAARAAIYLVRDPRDVAVSLACHNGSPIASTIKFMADGDGVLSADHTSKPPQLRQKLLGWSGHVTSWLDQTDVPVHLLRYEDLLAAPAKRFAAALAFVGRHATPSEIERAARHSDFAELQRQERDHGFGERVSDTAPFFRSGRVGGWRESLTAEQATAIAKSHGAVMARLGYAP